MKMCQVEASPGSFIGDYSRVLECFGGSLNRFFSKTGDFSAESHVLYCVLAAMHSLFSERVNCIVICAQSKGSNRTFALFFLGAFVLLKSGS